MRPVIHGGQGAFPPNVNVAGNQVELEASLAGFTIVFPRNPLRGLIEAVFGTNTPTGLQVARELENFNAGHAHPNFDAALARAVKEKLREGYALAAGPLETNMGRFCSYCEGFYATGLGVEHILPKAPFPAFYLAWENFLLACPSCNSLKGEQPAPGNPIFNPAPPDQIGYFNTTKASYSWPQWNPLAFREQQLQFEYFENGGWNFVNSTNSVAPTTTLQGENGATRTITANVSNGPNNVPVQIIMAGTDVEPNRFIELVQLNRPSFNQRRPGGEADVRVWERTLAWFTVLSVLRLLQASASEAEFLAKWTVMMNMIKRIGFYSVWVTVINRLGPNGAWKIPGQNRSVMNLFLTEIPGQFAGTNTANTP
jgi:hypothetical protein